MTKYIFVTGGVVSSLGKGITVASLGRILKGRGLSVSVLKLDPYLNVDPGTMSPYQHGEVYVTKDGCETDLDLGHYERFIDMDLTRTSNLTAGQVYSDIIAKERRGEFLGGTIQAIPHVTDAIKTHMLRLAEESRAEVIIVEVGGTVGDIEGLPFLEAIRQMRNEVGKDNVYYIHLTFLPYISTTGELKTKPTQHSVRELRSIGIQPDAIVCRCDFDLNEGIKRKISIHCDVPIEAVIELPTVDTVYEVPLILEDEGLGDLILDTLQIPNAGRDLAAWGRMVDEIKEPKVPLRVAVVGKYVDLRDSYLSVKEALIHAALPQGHDVEIAWISSEDVEEYGPDRYLESVQGIVVPGGFGPRGVEGMISTVRYARNHNVPFLGLCLGLQVMVIDVAREALANADANSTEFDPATTHPVIDLMPDQKDLTDMGGTMRLGVYPCELKPGTLAGNAYGASTVNERHRHRFEFNNAYKEELARAGLKATGMSPDGRLVEIMELDGQNFMVGVQFHPEFLSRPNRPHPLFRDFMRAAKRTLREGGQHMMPLEPSDSPIVGQRV
ncbi:MAG: CTP synthase [Chloroflexi bacterium]|nr:CTP synthase [Chloroflexota bacterium]MCI0791276.1 CTP synthase [Chloroflexota bacterium]MCI0796478.1 CTP synthase [Chloroflexota bacterium]MCI0869447.1 CTP synthase [Chloroflexota bacterium]